MTSRKSDAAEIARFLHELANELWLDSSSRWWPHFLFHVTDIRNVPSIIASNRLFCRSLAMSKRLMVTDNASPEIIAQTRSQVHDNVRLYFRPRTPTFFRNEGIRPRGMRELGAHCPSPVALLFDAKQVLGMSDTHFSDGNLASGRCAATGNDVSFLRQIPFQTVYHDLSFSPDERDEIVFRRHAEVIVPQELSLEGLRYLVTRSYAEFETLRTLLERDGRITANDRTNIFLRTRSQPTWSLFFNKWTYVERVDIIDDCVRVKFSPNTITPGPFTAKLAYESALSGKTSISTLNHFAANKTYRFPIPNHLRADPFWFTLRLDDSLAYQSKLVPSVAEDIWEMPF